MDVNARASRLGFYMLVFSGLTKNPLKEEHSGKEFSQSSILGREGKGKQTSVWRE